MTELRRRKASRGKHSNVRNGLHKGVGNNHGGKEAWSLWGMSPNQLFVNGVALLICLYLGYKHAWYMSLLHENNMWFSNIKVYQIFSRASCFTH